jgi:hypothetical protein
MPLLQAAAGEAVFSPTQFYVHGANSVNQEAKADTFIVSIQAEP